MPTTNPGYGTELVLKIGGTQISNLKSNGLQLTRDTREVTTKDSSDWKEFRPTHRSGTISFEGIHSKDNSYGYEEIRIALTSGTLITWELGTGTTGDLKESGSGYVTSLALDAPDGDNTMFSGEIQSTGVITYTTY